MEPYQFDDLKPIADMTKEDLNGEIAYVHADSQHPYHNPQHAQHSIAAERMKQVYGKLYPPSEDGPTSDQVSMGMALSKLGVTAKDIQANEQQLKDLKDGKSVLEQTQDGTYIIRRKGGSDE